MSSDPVSAKNIHARYANVEWTALRDKRLRSMVQAGHGISIMAKSLRAHQSYVAERLKKLDLYEQALRNSN